MLDELFQNMQNPQMYQQEDMDSEQSSNGEPKDSVGNKIITTQQTTQPPTYVSTYSPIMKSWMPIESAKSPGLTKEAPGKHTGFFNLNNEFMFGLERQIAEKDANFIYKVFSALNKKPIVAGKEIELSEIGKTMENPQFRKSLMTDALELETDPSLNIQVKFELNKSHATNLIRNGELAHSRSIFKKEMIAVANWADLQPAFKESHGFFTSLIDENGHIRNKETYNNLIRKNAKDKIAVWEKENPFPKDGPVNWQRTDMPNPMQRGVYRDPRTGKMVMIDSRPKMINSQEGWYINRASVQEGITNDLLTKGKYEDVKNNFLKAYDLDESPVTKLRTIFETRFGPSKGGEIQGTLGTIDFDTTPEKTAKPEFNELFNLMNIANSSEITNNGVIVSFGDKTGELPKSGLSPNIKTVLKAIYEDMQSSQDRRKDAKSLLPKGQLTFSSIVAGGEPYYAYNIKFHGDYINTKRFVGTAEKQGPAGADNNPELLTDGITIYVPKTAALNQMHDEHGQKMGVVSRLALDNERATQVSAIEGLFTVKNDIQIRIPNGGQLNLTRDPATEDTKVAGWNVVLNPNTGRMDTVHIPLQLVPLDRSTDLDWIVDDFFQNAFMFVKGNDALLKQRKSKKAVFDPNILKHQYQ